ncbi:MAG: HmuY family protein, partial [Cyclobacteriaceae bacterium]|nr:HmuY family protein [Cyclobacteriaceae bacterium HetDA_MAG_MS6]
RFYLIKDSQENIYKLRFNRLTSVTGKRGYPEFTYELL